MSNLSNIQFDDWHGKAFKVVDTPSGKRRHIDTGEVLPDEPGTISIVTPENKDMWDLPIASKEKVDSMRQNWSGFMKERHPIAKQKRGQIRRAMIGRSR